MGEPFQLHRLTNRTLWRIDQLQREPSAAEWEAEVERIVFDGAAASHLRDHGSAFLAAGASGTIVGAGLHYPHETMQVLQYIAAVFVDPRNRGRGLGRSLMRAIVDDALVRSGRPYVAWVVHPLNTAMVAISRELAAEIGVDEPTGYLQFAFPD